MRRELLLREELGIACGHDGVGGEEPRMAMIGMDAIATPRVMAEHDIGLEPPDPVRDLPSLAQPAVELTVDPSEEHDVIRAGPAEEACRLTLLTLARDHQLGLIHV